MIELKKLFKKEESIYFIVKKKEYGKFLQYCKDNGCKWKYGDNIDPKKDIYKCTCFMMINDSDALLLDSIVGKCDHNKLTDVWHYYFDDICEDRMFPIKRNCLFVSDDFKIPNDGSYFHYGIRAVVLPKLDNPSDINKLFKDFNSGHKWNTPSIFYKGGYEDTEELRKHCGIYDLNSKDKKVTIIANGDDVIDNHNHIYTMPNHSLIPRWTIGDEDIPRPLEPYEKMDSILIPDDINPWDIRCLNPFTEIYKNVYIPYEDNSKDTEGDYLRVCLHDDEILHRLELLLQLRNINYYIHIKQDSNDHDYYAYYVDLNNKTSKLINKVNFFTDWSNENLNLLNINVNRQERFGHILWQILASYKNAHKELSEIAPEKFHFVIKG